ncbi:MAG: DUF4843 domain-containing protein [Bacteroidetes bacterium]|nr:MAG: DUF4843 domain-containing protein [Bacteroidota bacterium]
MMIKKILLRIGILCLLLVAFNFIYTKWFYEKDLQQHAEIINLVREVPDDADIIYLGESSNVTFRGSDLDKRPISAFVGDHYPHLQTYDITKPAGHAGIYKVLLENIPPTNSVKTVVVTLNLRSFNAQWIYSELETPLQKSLVLIKHFPPLLNRFFLSFKAYDIKTKDERTRQFKRKWKRDTFHVPFELPYKNVTEWDHHMWKNGIQNEDGTKNQEMTELACHYIKAYAFQIDTLHNPRIKDFDAIVALAQKRGWNLVFNLMAENTEKAKALIGDPLLYFMEENTRLLMDYYGRKGVVVVNNLHQVADEQFIDQNWTTEHYAEKGRQTIGKNVAKAIRVWHEEDYVPVDYDQQYQTTFFNDCDHHVVWGQMQTATKEEVHSGKQASRTGKGADYSITLEYPLKLIPDSLKNQVAINLWLYQTSLDHEASLVIQAEGEAIEYYWKGYSITSYTKETGKWVPVEVVAPIPDRIKQADLIKIYIYNPSKELIYIDDFAISFKP